MSEPLVAPEPEDRASELVPAQGAGPGGGWPPYPRGYWWILSDRGPWGGLGSPDQPVPEDATREGRGILVVLEPHLAGDDRAGDSF